MIYIAAGLCAGIFVSLAKQRLNKAAFLIISTKTRGGLIAALYHLATQAANFVILLLCIKVNMRLFFACAAGLLLVPLVMAAAALARREKPGPP